MTREFVSLSIEGQLAFITLQRTKQLNALNRKILEEIESVVHEIKHNESIRVVLLQGEGRAFAAGADITEMKSLNAHDAAEFSAYGQQVFLQLERLPVPVIGLIHGFALGGGLELAMACNIRIAAEGTKFGQPEVTLGVLPGFGGSQRLPRIVGQGRALQLLLSGELISSDEAYRIGLVTKVVGAEELRTAGIELANRLAAMGPIALTYVKQAVYDGAEADLAVGLAMESALFGLAFATEDQAEGMTAFLERRSANFKNR